MPKDYRALARQRLAKARGPVYSTSMARDKYKSKYMKKTTRKGAYAPAKKKAMQIRRAPFVETKRQTDEILAGKNGELDGTVKDGIRNPVIPLPISNGVTGNANELTMLPVHTFFNMNKGLETSDMIGSAIYSRYLQARLEFEIPSGAKAIQHPCNLYLIHGWVTAPKNNTLHTTTTVGGQTRADLQEYVKNHIDEHFNQRRDKLQWIPKKTSSLKIEGYRKIKPNNNANLGVNTMMLNNPNAGGIQTYSVGAKPIVNMTCNWRTRRKIHYVLGTSETGSVEHNYPNFAWLPFMCVFNPTAGDFLDTSLYTGGEPQFSVRYNCIHYFTDS